MADQDWQKNRLLNIDGHNGQSSRQIIFIDIS